MKLGNQAIFSIRGAQNSKVLAKSLIGIFRIQINLNTT